MKFSVPFNGRNGISTYNVVLKVYDLLGREVATLVDEEKSPGNYEVKFDPDKSGQAGTNLPSGVYFYRLSAGSYSEMKKMILLK
ncbi:MAG: T9SS type A sorting domain-containing protein [Bacteroidetes bacterium]|nr:T9SS type A sorting domain-containing protein [Bacteroidota bacterium]